MSRQAKRTGRWSMAFELATIESAIDGARMLVDLVANAQAQDDHDARNAPTAAAAVLALTALRVRDIQRVLGGDIEAERLCAAHNAADAKVASCDIVLGASRKRTR